ncbi:putative transcriptional regulatory protein [Cladobotryum mycophilum]|uniref:Transcriptional regulatory protein n=1 Tax=Cladobotryum mycophilum TaxID=491253 RepID=A0ABR0SBC8_9HYPO
MSNDRAGMRRHQFQNAQHPSLNSASRLYHGNVPGGMNADSSPNTIMGVNSQFGDFSFPYAGLSDQNVMVPIDGHQAASFSQHPAMNSVMASASASPSHAINPIVPLPGPSLSAEPDPQRASIDNSDDPNHEKHTPASNTLEDPTTDEFGMPSHRRGDGTDLGGKTKDGKDSAPPAWSELKTKAGKDRKRLPLACIACRRKKIRCSGEKPACKHCLRSRIPCVYKVTTRKAAPRTDYMAMLDKRLKRMEERIIKILPKNDQSSLSAIPRAVVKPAIPGTGAAASTKPAPKKRNADDAFGPDLEAWAKAPRPKMPENEPGSPDSREDEENQLQREGIDSLPPKDVQEHLAEVFFDSVYGQSYHLLHKPSYMRKLKNDALPPVLILSVCAIAARFTSNPKLNSASKQFMRGEEWASIARDICTKRYDWPNITILTCLLILGLHEFGTCHGGRAWALGGQAIRMAFALHLHKDLEYDPHARNRKTKLSFIDREIRRRTMWACFLMDRFNSSGTDRPIFIKEETIKIPLPVSEKYFQLDMPAHTEYLDGKVPEREIPEEAQLKEPKESMGVSAYTIRSISIWGRIITYINQGGRDTDSHPMWSPESEYGKLVRQTEGLLRSLPEAIQYSRKNLEIHRTENTASHLLFLHMSIQQNLLFLNQAAVTFSQDRCKKAPKEFVPQSSAKTFLAANKISDLLRDAEDAQCSVSTPFAGYCAFSSTAIHITGIFSGNPTMKATAEANSAVNVKFLRKMMKYWGMFHWMVENIRTQYRNALDAARVGGPTHGSTASSPILQYSDWFNRYPHGVSDPDYMDPAIHRKREKGEDGVLEQKPELQSVGDFFTAVGSTQSTDGKDGSRGPVPKRKASKKQPNTTANKVDSQQPQRSPSDNGGPSGAGQAGAQLQHQRQRQHSGQGQRKFSGQLGGQTTGPMNFGPVNVPQSQSSSHSVVSNPDHLQSFGQSMPAQSGFFSTDMLSMNLGQPPDSLLQALDRQFTFGGFSMEPDNMTAMMSGFGAWNDLSSQTGQANNQLDSTQGGKNNDTNAQGQFNDALNQFSNQDAVPGWFMPLEGNQDLNIGGGEMDPFGNLFGGPNGMTSINQNGDIQNYL